VLYGIYRDIPLFILISFLVSLRRIRYLPLVVSGAPLVKGQACLALFFKCLNDSMAERLNTVTKQWRFSLKRHEHSNS